MSLLLAALAAVSMQAAASPEAEIGAVLDRLNEASTAADADAYFALFTPDARFIGTDATERWSLPEFRAYAEPYFAQGKGWTYNPHDRHITIAEIPCRCIAWFDEELTHAAYGEARGSGVLHLTDSGWRIEQYVLSFPVPNDKADAVIALIKAP